LRATRGPRPRIQFLDFRLDVHHERDLGSIVERTPLSCVVLALDVAHLGTIFPWRGRRYSAVRRVGQKGHALWTRRSAFLFREKVGASRRRVRRGRGAGALASICALRGEGPRATSRSRPSTLLLSDLRR